jgi:hypothetical protein
MINLVLNSLITTRIQTLSITNKNYPQLNVSSHIFTLTSLSLVLEKLTVAELIKKLPTLYEIWRVIIEIHKNTLLNPILSQVNSDNISHPVPLRYIVTLSFPVCLHLQLVSCFQVYTSKILYTFFNHALGTHFIVTVSILVFQFADL